MAILERSDNGPVARLTLNHPEKLNALSDAMLAALQDQFDRLADDSALIGDTIPRYTDLPRTRAFIADAHDILSIN